MLNKIVLANTENKLFTQQSRALKKKRVRRTINTVASIWGEIILIYYLFLEAQSFPRGSLSKNCSLLGTDCVCIQISVCILAPNEGHALFIHLHFGDSC